MLRITIFAVGKLKEQFWKDAVAEYLKRLGGYAKIEVRELPDSNAEKEASALLSALPERGPIILMDIRGKETSSEGLAQKIDNYALNSDSHISFIIGGSDGVTKEVKQRATERISFGPITLPAAHAMRACGVGLFAPCRTLGTASIPDMTGQVQVVMGDNIMDDDDTLRERDRADVAAGLLEPWRYMVRWQGYTEEDAKAATSATAGVPFEV